MSGKGVKCSKCRQVIQWETMCGIMRVFEQVGRRKVYRTRCGCGDVQRSSSGRKLREVSK